MPLVCRHALLGALLIVSAGCATLPRNAVPVDRVQDAEIPGFEGVRAWGGILSPGFQADMVESARIEQQLGEFPTDAEGRPIYHSLALSGGGSDGAFGAGFLYGWSETGTRPDFKLVTGISTGALIAPFAFLGRDFDQELKAVYTTITTEDIMQRLNVFRILFRSESLASTDPLKSLVEQHVSMDTLRAVAEKHDRGHRLYIGTAHMDAQDLMVWNMGLIAKRQTPEALDLFHKVMVASASIPAAFPPVIINVTVDGETYDEMHADGGTNTQVFFYAGTIDISAARREAYGYDFKPGGSVYIIRNGHLEPEPAQIERKLTEISGRAVETMIKSAAVSDLYRIYSFSRRDNIGFHYTSIPSDYVSQSKELFDREEMNRLFQVGYELAKSDDPWQEVPPGLESITVNQ